MKANENRYLIHFLPLDIHKAEVDYKVWVSKILKSEVAKMTAGIHETARPATEVDTVHFSLR